MTIQETTAQRMLRRRLEERVAFVEGLLATDTEAGRQHARRIVNRELEDLVYETAERDRREQEQLRMPDGWRDTEPRGGSIDQSLLGFFSLAGAIGLAACVVRVMVECFRGLLALGGAL